MSRALFFENVAGIAGDMFAASFLDAGIVTLAELSALPAQLGFEGVTIEARPVQQATMGATYLTVTCQGEAWRSALVHAHSEGKAPHAHAPEEMETHLVHDGASHHHTHYADIDRMIERSPLVGAVRDRARKIFRLLAEAEAAAHGMPVEAVAFHEVGAVDSILDVVMAAYCVERAGVGRFFSTPIKPGRGLVTMAHGTHPVPPPASARLLIGLPVAPTPAAIARPNVELSTPTGIAILKSLAPEFVDGVPAGTVRAQGMGSGTMEFAGYPNVFRVTLLDAAEAATGAAALPYETDRVVEFVCNLDDDTGERIAWLAEQLLAQGALDVWQTPVSGKKGRIAVCLSALAEESRWAALADWLLRHSSTFGVRHRTWDRLKLARTFERRATPEGEVTFKVGRTTTGEELKAKPEFEELKRIWERPS